MVLGVKKILKKTKDNSAKVAGLIKPLTKPVLLPSKIGLKMARLGVEVAKRPLEKLISKTSEKIVTEIKIEDIKKMMMASAQKIALHQEEINKINVWPVADKDTGYNLAATILGIEGTIERKDYDSMKDLVKDIKEVAMINARGNVGMIYTGYLIKFLDEIKNLELIDAFRFSRAMKKGERGAYQSIFNPTEGTILDVISAAEKEAYRIVKTEKEKNIIKVLEGVFRASSLALKETKEKLKALKENNVVDAGGLGFLKILEAWLESLKGITLPADLEIEVPVVPMQTEEKLKYPYEIIATFNKAGELEMEKLKQDLFLLGDSLDIIEAEDKIKIHIHTNQTPEIIEKIKGFPELEYKIENIISQPNQIKRKPLGLVVDQTADLPDYFLKDNQIKEVVFRVRTPKGEIIKSKEEIYRKMEEAIKNNTPLPTTSQPSFEDFRSAYQRALEIFEKILVITVSAKLSGTYSSARIARSFFKKPEKMNINVFDCHTAEVGEGLVAIRTQELISQGKKSEEILEHLKKFCPKIKVLAYVKDFKYVVHGGRVRIPKFLAFLISFIQKIGLNLLVEVKNGKVKFYGVRFGKDIAKVLAAEIDELREQKEIRLAIAHAASLETAQRLNEELEKKPKIKISFISFVSPVVGAHAGPGAIIVGFHEL